MTPDAFLALVLSCHLNLPPTITPERLLTYAQAESGLDPSSISPPNRDGSRDYGLLQINERWFSRFGVDRDSVREPCTNLRIGAAILADNDRAAACRYNTGRLSCSNGYPERIEASAVRLHATRPAPRPTPPRETCDVPAWDVWARCPSSAGRETSPTVALRGLIVGSNE